MCFLGMGQPTPMLMESLLCATSVLRSFRQWASPQSVSGATAGMAELGYEEDGLDFLDWSPMLWHLRGFDLIVVSLYLESGVGLRSGLNAQKLTTLASFLKAVKTPWLIAGTGTTAPRRWPSRCGRRCWAAASWRWTRILAS